MRANYRTNVLQHSGGVPPRLATPTLSPNARAFGPNSVRATISQANYYQHWTPCPSLLLLSRISSAVDGGTFRSEVELLAGQIIGVGFGDVRLLALINPSSYEW